MTCLKYPGSKSQIADWIISHFPAGYAGMTYFEGFFGSGAVMFRKKRSTCEIINDRDKEVYNLFLQIRENPEQLAFMTENTPWSRDDFITSYQDADEPLEKARRFLVRMWFSIGARSCEKNGFRLNIAKNGGNFTAFHRKLPEVIFEISDRLKHDSGGIVQIENQDALTLIKKYNRENVLMYLDPPYVLSTRKNRKIYKHEMDDSDHEKLLEEIKNSKASIIISGYDNDLYNSHLSKWIKDTISSVDEKGSNRMECIWMNYKGYQMSFF
ncbi:MAG: DNA adenine methylase [Spirochaetaceae bacterium]|jgi:DNA adenine methylase|nr:DNA adenine methylase [Spirochaetaceae bacterium]